MELYSTTVDARGQSTPGSPRSRPARRRCSPATDRCRGPSEHRPIPFVDIANRMVTSTSGFSPAAPGRSSHSRRSSRALDQPGNADRRRRSSAAANELTAGICEATGGQPGDVCSSKGCATRTRPSGSLRPVPAATASGRSQPGSAGRLSRRGAPPAACARPRSGHPRCRGARGCGSRSRGTRPAPRTSPADRLRPILALELLLLALSVCRRKEDLRLRSPTRRPELPCFRLLHCPHPPSGSSSRREGTRTADCETRGLTRDSGRNRHLRPLRVVQPR